MILNPVERYFTNKGRQEGRQEGWDDSSLSTAKKMLEKGFSIDEISELTGLSKKDILNGKIVSK